MKKKIAFIFTFLTCTVFFAQVEKIERAVSVKTSEKNAVRVYEVERSTEIIGNYSAETIEYMIENRTDRILEGEFEFPLKDGECVSGFALDINGKMRDAVSVEKEKGRLVFEDIVRRGVDPGLVEMTEGNNFKTRVYPIPANGVRHLKVTVEKEIADVNVSSKTFTQTKGKDTYFYFYENVDLKNIVCTRNLPKKITVLFDISSSAKNRDVKKEIELIDLYAKKIGGEPEIDFITFSNSVHESKKFKFSDSLKSDLENFISSQNFDGATSYSFNTGKINSDEIIFFTDGIENWNEADKNKFFDGIKIPVFTVNSSKSANYSKLKKIAYQNKGVFVNLEECDVSSAVEKLCIEPLRIISVEFNSKDFSDIFPMQNEIVEKGFSVSGILKKKKGKLKISLGRNGKVEKVIEKTISAVDSQESEKISRLWAMKKIVFLEADYELNKNEILELAKKFTIVTKETSLIVLENISDYVRYGIVPPAELKDEYEKYINRNNISKKSAEGIPAYVYENFEQVKKWWNKKSGEFIKKDETEYPVLLDTNAASTEFAEGETDMLFETENAADTVTIERRQLYRNYALNQSLASKEKSSISQPQSQSTISLQSWNSNADYISVLKKTPSEKMYEKYLELKKAYEKSPAFYMEVSDYFAEEGFEKESIRILSNLAELNLENTDVLRALGNKLIERKEYSLASSVFENLTKIRSDVPQFFRDYALACNLCGETQKAIDALYHIASKDWDGRYREIQQIALNDMNAIIEASKNKKLDLSKIDKKLMQNFDVDVRIVLTWNTDDCDIDLWVTDPDGEKCFYGHKLTFAGGRISRDFTQGYGPEEFMIKSAPKGKYKIEANYFGNHQQKILQPVVVQAEVYTNFGRENQKREVLTLQLDDVKQTFFIGEIEFN